MCSASHRTRSNTMSRPVRSPRSLARFALSLACLAFAVLCTPGVHADGQVAYVSQGQAQQKLSPELLAALSAPSVASLTWAKDTYAGRLVKVLVLAKPTVDSDLADLRRAIVNANGSVYYRYISVGGVAALLPAKPLPHPP